MIIDKTIFYVYLINDYVYYLFIFIDIFACIYLRVCKTSIYLSIYLSGLDDCRVSICRDDNDYNWPVLEIYIETFFMIISYQNVCLNNLTIRIIFQK